MLSIKILPDGNLKLSASNACRKWIKENENSGYWQNMAELFEAFSCNGSFVHFDAGQGNPFIGLTSAPAVAECMDYDDNGNASIDGRAWAFNGYMIRDDLGELKNKGYVIYNLIA